MKVQNSYIGGALAGCAAALAFAFAALPHDAVAQGGSGKANGANGNPAVVPPNARFRGFSYEDLEAQFWQALAAIPIVEGDHPLFSGGAIPGEKGIVFLAAPFGGVELDFTIPPGTALFIPIVNTECSEIEPDPFHGDDEAEQRECANDWIDGASELEVTIDGVPVDNLASAYRFESDQFTFGPLPENNIFGAPEGATSTAVDAGYYVFIKPLSVGTHEIHLSGVLVAPDGSFEVVIDTTYNVTVSKR